MTTLSAWQIGKCSCEVRNSHSCDFARSVGSNPTALTTFPVPVLADVACVPVTKHPSGHSAFMGGIPRESTRRSREAHLQQGGKPSLNLAAGNSILSAWRIELGVSSLTCIPMPERVDSVTRPTPRGTSRFKSCRALFFPPTATLRRRFVSRFPASSRMRRLGGNPFWTQDGGILREPAQRKDAVYRKPMRCMAAQATNGDAPPKAIDRRAPHHAGSTPALVSIL
jgi:hypothetical protein